MSQRSSVRWLGSSLLAAALVAGASPDLAQARSKAKVVSGELSAPSAASPVAIAGAYLATRPAILGDLAPAALRVVSTRTLTRGSSVRYVQTHAGLDVLGGTVTVRLDAEGRVRWAVGAPSAVPSGFDVTPVLSPEAAIARLQGEARFGLAGMSIPATRHARLVIDASRPGGRPTLAYVITAPGNPLTLEVLRFRVDANTGEVLSVENLVRYGGPPAHLGNVFTSNPTKTPTLTQQPLGPWLTPGQDPVRLQGPDVKVLNCLDQMQCQDLMGLSLHSCTHVQGAQATAAGDFLSIQRPASDLDGEDQFAEVQMFFHVNRVSEFFRDLGFGGLDDQPLTAIVNQRIPIDLADLFGSIGAATCTNGVPPAGHQLYKLDNALFTSDGSLFGITGGAIVFGQGTGADFAYDGDVVYHEFTHAVMGTLTPDFASSPLDEYGYDPTGPGLGEGTSDYFSSALTGDPDVAEYAGPALAGSGQFLRTLANDKTCPSSLWGEVHQDGEQWGGALWDIRSALEVGQRAAFDIAVFDAISAFADTTDQLSAAALVVAEVTTSLGAPAGATATARFAARGLDDCNDRVIDVPADSGSAKDVLFLGGSEIATPAPGPVQFKLDVPAGTTRITISTLASQANGGGFGGGSAPAVKLIVKPGADPILWTYSGANAAHDASASGNVTCSTAGNMPCTGTVDGPFTAGPHMLQLINAGGGAVLQQIFVTTSSEPLAPDAGPGGADAAPGAPDAGPGGGADDDSGCGCRVGGQDERSPLGGGALALAGLAAFLLVVRRRR